MPSNKLIQALRKRDEHCWHCGNDQALVPHHRKNRGAGGRKSLDRLDNLILICAYWNGIIEADAEYANQAREYGHKLKDWEDLCHPVFDATAGRWYKLTETGEKIESEPDSGLF